MSKKIKKEKVSSSASPKPVIIPLTKLTFFDAIKDLALLGKRIQKLEWGNPEVHFALMRDGILQIHNDSGFHSWIVSEADIIGVDYVEVI